MPEYEVETSLFREREQLDFGLNEMYFIYIIKTK